MKNNQGIKIGVVTDEISMDVDTAFKLGTEMGIQNYELRFLWDKRIPLLEEDEINRLEELISFYQVNITALSPGIFKLTLSDPDLEFHKNELLERTMDLGDRLGVNRIIIFGIKREEKDHDEDFHKVCSHIQEVVLKAEERGFKVLLENEPGWWADTAENTLKILQKVNNLHFALNWDPGNAVCTGEPPFPEGYNMLKQYIGNVHFKDAKLVENEYEWTTVDRGYVDWKGQLKALKDDGYQGLITIETHCKPLVKNTKLNLNMLKKWLAV